jgi:hypothetical protein
MIMTAHPKQGQSRVLDPSIMAAERRIAENNERIILDLIRGRDTSAAEEKVARDLVALARLRRGRGASRRSPH